MSKLRERATQTDFSLTLNRSQTPAFSSCFVLIIVMHEIAGIFYFKGSKTLINCVSVSRFVLPCLIDAVRVLSCFTLFSGQRIIINGP